MAQFYEKSTITPKKSMRSGHEVFPDAVYRAPESQTDHKVVYKENKYGQEEFSRWEVAISGLAKLFFSENLTAHQGLVRAQHKILGILTEHLCYVINRKEAGAKDYYALKNANYVKKTVSRAEDIPYYFFDTLPQGFFTQILEAEKTKALTVDFASLASILASSYTLEEDDLHKGNFGFYLVQRDNKPHVVFFKIDHDLMFVDSIMSFKSSRPFHWFHGAHAFDITSKDLLNFPAITSTNAHWPTNFSYFAKPWDSKKYRNFKEVESFALLADKKNSAFTQAKWKSFYKHILIPKSLIIEDLKLNFDVKNPVERAQIALMAQATFKRQACLKSVLFATKEFRDFVAAFKEEDFLKELEESFMQQKERIGVLSLKSKEDKQFFLMLKDQIRQQIVMHQEFCSAKGDPHAGDSPLHTAIKLGEFRYEETLQLFGPFINTNNAAKKTPLDVAVDLYKASKEKRSEDPRKDFGFIVNYLLQNGAKESKSFQQLPQKDKDEIRSYTLQTLHLKKASAASGYTAIKDLLRDIGEDSHCCLKSKKKVAIECLIIFIENNKKNPDYKATLTQLRKDINEESAASEAAPVKFIRQLRSSLWFVRLVRGLYGRTSTLAEMNSLIDNGLKYIQKKDFFKEPQPSKVDEKKPLPPSSLSSK